MPLMKELYPYSKQWSQPKQKMMDDKVLANAKTGSFFVINEILLNYRKASEN